MRTSTFLAPLLFAASSLAQGVEEGIEPSASAPAGCTRDVKGNFTIGVENFFAPKSKRESAQEAADGALLCTLEDGILRDQYSRTGSIVANQQFQFDGPPQAGAIYTGGFSVCKNNSLAIGGSTRWWRCMSGKFGNLYDEWIGDQCTEIRIVVDMLDKPTPSSSLVLPSSTAASLTATGGSGSSRSSSAIASPSGASSASSNSTASDASSASASSQAATSSASASGSTSGSATGSASRSSSPTGTGAAPPAGEGGAPASTSARGVVLAAFLAVLGAALVL
ncbi:hypothetical protein G6514_006902 [Epicoccum nigrum]|nr:hypothetical protein G6514_006902 [Epicoccum nigrum]